MSTPERPVEVGVAGAGLAGDLTLPPDARAVVVFAHGSGSGRRSPRNRHVAAALAAAGLGTLLVDLLSAPEQAEDERTRELRFDIELLGRRVVGTIDWLAQQDQLGELPVGCYGASTGAAAALVAAAQRPRRVGAVVSRGGRTDLAGPALARVSAPTLMIAGSHDAAVIAINSATLAALAGEARLEIVPGAGHLFEEPGALERVTALARDWFAHHLTEAPA